MKEFIKKNNPLVSILMAVYNPNEKWFEEQLKSLNAQTYSNSELLIYDDASDISFDEKTVKTYIKKFPYRIIRGEKNFGSNKAFERLTAEGAGKYFSYCDQDDVWHTDKIERMVAVLESTGSPLVCSDLAIIDGDGKRIADSITKIHKRHKFYDGRNMAGHLMIKNFVTGCAMMIRADIAKKSIPFVDSLIHDQWLAINAALKGRIEVIREPLIEYRQHDGNQTGVLKGVKSKRDYYDVRIGNMRSRLKDYKKRLSDYTEIRQTLSDLEEFNEARSRYFFNHKLSDFRTMIKYRSFAREDILFETIMPFMPNRIVKILLWAIRNGAV